MGNIQTGRNAVKRTPAKSTERRAKAREDACTEAEPRVAFRKRVAKATAGWSRMHPDVIAFLRELDHPLKAEIELVRKLILGVSPEISEGIKWNSPSFRTTDWFATFNLRARGSEQRVWVILHLGAKSKSSTAKVMKIPDPMGLLEWLAKDRCLVTFKDAKDIKAKRVALQNIIREWIACLPK